MSLARFYLSASCKRLISSASDSSRLYISRNTKPRNDGERQVCRHTDILPKKVTLASDFDSKTVTSKDLQRLGFSRNLVNGVFDSDLFQFRFALSNENPTAAMNLYNTVDKSMFSHTDVKCLLSIIHGQARKLRQQTDDLDFAVRATLSWIQSIQRDLQEGILKQKPIHWVKILDYYKEARAFELGKELWEWLHESIAWHSSVTDSPDICNPPPYPRSKIQSNIYEIVDSRIFGSAIGLLTKAGESLQTCEALYKEAIEIRRLGHSISLLRGMALLYLHHNQMQKFFDFFVRAENFRKSHDIATHNDHFYESTIYHLLSYEQYDAAIEVLERACRGLAAEMPRGEAISAMFRDFKKAGLTNYMLRTFRLYMSKGGSSFHTHTALLIASILELHTVTPQEELLSVVHEFIEICKKFHVKLSISAYNAMIIGFANMKRLDLVDLAVKWMEKDDLAPNQVTYRSLLKAFGILPNTFQRTQEWWNTMRRMHNQKRLVLDDRDWLMVLRAVAKEGEPGWSWVEKNVKSQADRSIQFKVNRWIQNLREGKEDWHVLGNYSGERKECVTEQVNSD